MAIYRLSYYPWITQHLSLDETDKYVRQFASALSDTLGNGSAVTVLAPLEVDRQIEQLLAGSAEIAFMNPLGYVFARQRPQGSAVASIAIALRLIDGKIGETYFAQLYTRNTSSLRKGDAMLASKLRGKSIGYGVPYSTSNFLVNAWSLKKQLKVHPFTFFSRTEFLGGHDIVAKAVYEGRIDIGAGHDGVIIDLANQYGYGDASEKLVQILRSEPIPSDPVVVRISDAGERRALQEALVAAGNTPSGRAALAGFWGNAQGLKAIDADAYDLLTTIMRDFNFSEQDLLRST